MDIHVSRHPKGAVTLLGAQNLNDTRVSLYIVRCENYAYLSTLYPGVSHQGPEPAIPRYISPTILRYTEPAMLRYASG